MHIIDYGTAVMLQEIADLRESEDYPDRTIKKYRSVAYDHLKGAQKASPIHQDTTNRIQQLELSKRHEFFPYLFISNEKS